MPTWIAHMTKDGREQTLTDHLQQVARLSCEFARPFHNENLATAAGLLHDIGKASPKAQLRMHGADIQVDHATAGAYRKCNHHHRPYLCVFLGPEQRQAISNRSLSRIYGH